MTLRYDPRTGREYEEPDCETEGCPGRMSRIGEAFGDETWQCETCGEQKVIFMQAETERFEND
jgi:hypothetical protein